MGTAIATLLAIGALIIGVGVLAQSSFKSVADVTDAWTQLEDTSQEVALTRVEVVETAHTPPTVDVTLKNSGLASLERFSKWDVLVQYYEGSGTYHAKRLTYTTAASPGNDEWTVQGIYQDASAGTPEVFQPNVLDPGEEITLRMTLSPAARTSPQNWVSIATPNGVATSGLF